MELHCASAFSFLRGASLPEDLMARAAELELPAVALLDVNGVYGAPRFYQAARTAGVRALVGAEVVLQEGPDLRESLRRTGRNGPLGLAPPPPVPAPPAAAGGDGAALDGVADDLVPRVTLLVESKTGYRNLCKLLTAAAAGRPKGSARATWELIAEHSAGLHCLTGGAEGPVAQFLRPADAAGAAPAARPAGGIEVARKLLERMAAIFPQRLHVEVQRHRLRDEEHRNRALLDLARQLRLPVVATNGVRYARAADKALQDVLASIRCHTSLDRAGRLLERHRESHLKSARQMAQLFADLPQAVAASGELAARLDFTLADLGYRFPAYPLPPGETPASYLRHLTWNGARARFRPLTGKAQAQIQKELDLIEKLDLAGYFLIVWDIVRFCIENRILAQGRGSAANSAVCYALSITAVDPVKMDLLFERFLSEERGEWPDIDLDLPSGDQRERVIQYVYQRYGNRGADSAAMTANVITYRDRSATREVAKAFGYSAEQIDTLARQLGSWSYDMDRGDSRSFATEVATAGFDSQEPRMLRFADMWQRIHDLPRHLGQHSGGMVIAAGRLDEIVPLEPAAMPGRVVVQWDKDDCANLGIIKVDLLGLGMLNAIEEMVPTIRTCEGIQVDLAHLPADDPKVYKMLREADTVGVFQVESRAQMASLPRNNPKHFYDLVIQVAIIRPGPIAGNMASPYFERRAGRQTVTYPHPSLQPILERTLGVPIFQEQLLRIAMVAAGFTGGEAEELRRAMGFKRSVERMHAIESRLRSGMNERGITGAAQDQIIQGITSFALYGFPESHAASFALIAYASAYLKAHHPTAFYLGILNAWPMGFYHPATLVRDAQRHGVPVLPIDVQTSGWRCRWESPTVSALRQPSPTRSFPNHPLRQPAATNGFSNHRAARFADPTDSIDPTDPDPEQSPAAIRAWQPPAIANDRGTGNVGGAHRAAGGWRAGDDSEAAHRAAGGWRAGDDSEAAHRTAGGWRAGDDSEAAHRAAGGWRAGDDSEAAHRTAGGWGAGDDSEAAHRAAGGWRAGDEATHRAAGGWRAGDDSGAAHWTAGGRGPGDGDGERGEGGAGAGAGSGGKKAAGAIRLGLRYVRGLRAQSGQRIESERQKRPFADLADFVERCGLQAQEIETLASIGALSCFGLSRRAALWQVARLGRPAGPLLSGLPESEPSPLPEMTMPEQTQADYGGTQLTLGPHPLAYRRAQLRKKGIVTAADLVRYRNGDLVRTAGAVIVRQRPSTAKGLLFLTLEDETGMSQAVISPNLLQQHRRLIVGSPGLVVEGVLQKRDGSISVRGERFWALDDMLATPSHDFH